MNPDREKKLDKVRKLLALSNSPNQHEAKAAAARAQQILASMGLERLEDDIGLHGVPDDFPRRVVATGNAPMWVVELWTGAAELNGCRCFIRREPIEVILIGETETIEATYVMAAGIRANVENLCMRDVGHLNRLDSRTYCMGFVMSCLDSMTTAQKGVHMAAQASGQQAALVRRRATIDELNAWCREHLNVQGNFQPEVVAGERLFELGKRRGRE